MIIIIVVKDQNMKELGVLDKSHNILIERRVNELWYSSFSLPKDDPKNKLCDHMNYIEITSPSGRYMGLYRIMPIRTKKNRDSDHITYECEHVLATLIDDVIDGQVVLTHLNTRSNLQELIDLQETKRWELGEVEFNRQFNYSFENENGLLAPILEIPKNFNEPYEFTFDTTVYPWKLNLIRPSNEVTSEIRWGKDMIDFDEVSDPTNIVNYIIPKGAGEGINQLTIESVNDGKRYLKDDESIEKWGKKSYIWIDKRFEDAESLMASGQARLDRWKEPKISFDCKSVDLTVKDQRLGRGRLLNGITNIIVEDNEYLARIVSERIPDLHQEWDVYYEVNNKVDDITTTQTDLERKQQVNDSYAQGATNLMTFSYQDNADNNIPALIPFYIDDDVVNVNTCELTFRTKPFRAYSRATDGGGATVKSTSAGGGTNRSTSSGGSSTQTSSSGGGVSKSTNSGGSTTRTSGGGGNHTHLMFRTIGFETDSSPNTSTTTGVSSSAGGLKLPGNNPAPAEFYTQGASGNHTHNIDIPSHRHEFETPNHTHSVNIPSHTHDFETPNHTHDINLPNHTHNVAHEIVELNTLPDRVTIKVDGSTVDFSEIEGDRIDLLDYMNKDKNGKIERGRHEVEILPDGLARIEADLIMRVFIKSQLGGVY